MVANETKHNPVSDVALKYGIDKSMVTKWKKDENKIVDAAGVAHKKHVTKIRPSRKHQKIFNELYKEFTNARSKGLKVSYAWLYIQAKKIIQQINPSNLDKFPKSAFSIFTRKYKIN